MKCSSVIKHNLSYHWICWIWYLVLWWSCCWGRVRISDMELRDPSLNVKGWSDILRPVVGKDLGHLPTITAEKEKVHIVYKYVSKDKSSLFYMNSLDNGRTWKPYQEISGKLRINSTPSLAVRDNLIICSWVTMGEEEIGLRYKIFYAYSDNGGVSWSTPKPLITEVGHAISPKLLEFKGDFYIFWIEMEEQLLTTKDKIGFELLQEYINSPRKIAVERRKIPINKATIKVARLLYQKGLVEGTTVIEKVISLPEDLTVVEKPEEVVVLWREEGKVQSFKSQNPLAGWAREFQLARQLDANKFWSVIYGDDGYIIVETPKTMYEPAALTLKMGNEPPLVLTKPHYIRSAPALAWDKVDIHILWQSGQEDNNWLNYMRTDRHPPISYLVQPTDPNITEHLIEFRWEGKDDISQRILYSYRIGEQDWEEFSTKQSVVIKALPDGEYTFYLRAKDAAGNIQPTPATFRFNTYRVPPDTQFVKNVPKEVYRHFVEASWTGTDNSTPPSDLLFSYTIDDQPWSAFTNERYHIFTNLKNGKHIIKVRAMDADGNIDQTPAEVEFTVILGMSLKFIQVPPAICNKADAKFKWEPVVEEGVDKSGLTFSYRLDNSEWSEFTNTQEITLEDVGDGEHTFYLKAKDALGNETTSPLTYSFLVDSEPPIVEAAPKVIRHERPYPMIEVNVSDNFTKPEKIKVAYRINNQPWSEHVSERVLTIPRPIWPWSLGYRVYIKACDEAGNEQENYAMISYLFYDRYPRAGLVLAVLLMVVAIIIVGAFKGDSAIGWLRGGENFGVVTWETGGEGAPRSMVWNLNLTETRTAQLWAALIGKREREVIREDCPGNWRQGRRWFYAYLKRPHYQLNYHSISDLWEKSLNQNIAQERELINKGSEALREIIYLTLWAYRANSWLVYPEHHPDQLIFLQTEYLEEPGFYNTMDVIYNSDLYLFLTQPNWVKSQLLAALEFNQPNIPYIQHDIGMTRNFPNHNLLSHYSMYACYCGMPPMEIENSANFIILNLVYLWLTRDKDYGLQVWQKLVDLAEFIVKADLDNDGIPECFPSTTFEGQMVEGSTYLGLKAGIAIWTLGWIGEAIGRGKNECEDYKKFGEEWVQKVAKGAWRGNFWALGKSHPNIKTTQNLNPFLYPILLGLPLPVPEELVKRELAAGKSVSPLPFMPRMNELHETSWLSQIIWFGLIDHWYNQDSDYLENMAERYRKYLQSGLIDAAVPVEAVREDGSLGLQPGYPRAVCIYGLGKKLW